eukprot:5783103-Prymnesium_polylepis.1
MSFRAAVLFGSTTPQLAAVWCRGLSRGPRLARGRTLMEPRTLGCKHRPRNCQTQLKKSLLNAIAAALLTS